VEIFKRFFKESEIVSIYMYTSFGYEVPRMILLPA